MGVQTAAFGGVGLRFFLDPALVVALRLYWGGVTLPAANCLPTRSYQATRVPKWEGTEVSGGLDSRLASESVCRV